MDDSQATRLTGPELKNFFDRLFPDGFAGADVLRELAPAGWESSPLFACFHPSPEQVFKEELQSHRHRQEMVRIFDKHRTKERPLEPSPEPTLDEVLADWVEHPVDVDEELTHLLGACLWDVFSDNHEVTAADGRIVDIGSFRGASAFLDEYLAKPGWEFLGGDEYRFYLGTVWISRRADLTPVYRMIFRRLKSQGAQWKYEFPQLYVVHLPPKEKPEEAYSPSEAFAREQEEREREKLRAELDEIENEARREAMDHPPPKVVQAYQEVYGMDPIGWPPV